MSAEFTDAMVPRLLNGPCSAMRRTSSDEPNQGSPMNPYVREHRHGCNNRDRPMPERPSVTRPPEDKSGHRGKNNRESCRLVHHSLRAPRRTAVGPPIVLDVMKYEHGEDKRNNRVDKRAALMCEKGRHKSNDKENVGGRTF